MNPLIQLKKATPVFLVALVCFGLSPTMQAVSPPPDGGYPGGNTAEGQNALLSLTTGGFNTAVGFLSLRSDTTGQFNTAIGAGTLFANTGDENTATGVGALLLNTTGSDNTAIGTLALSQNTEGSDNIAVGVSAGEQVTTASHVICIGAAGANVNNGCYIGNIFLGSGGQGITVTVDASGHLGTAVSSQRFKDQIKPMDDASEAIFALRPVTFRYKKEIDPTGTSQLGLVAEEVEKVNPDLVVRDKEGKPYSVRYDQVNAMLLNEFLKEHRTVQELKSNAAKQETTIARQQKQIEALTAGLQKVSAQIEASKSAPQVVNNP